MDYRAKIAIDVSQSSFRARPSLRPQPCRLPSLSSTTRKSASPAPETPAPHPIPKKNNPKQNIKSSELFAETKIGVN